MNGPNERDEIAVVAGIIAAARLRAAKDDASPALTAARAILASDWLAERDRRTAATAVREVAEVRWELGEALVAIERVRTAQADRRRALSLYAPDRNPALEAHLDAIDNALSVCDEEPQ